MLDARLSMVYSLLPDGEFLCDIGTDHCKLAVYAAEQGRVPGALATDLRRGPLAAARKTVEAHAMTDNIQLMLSDGFINIPQKLFDKIGCFVIAGMGGELIESILRKRFTDKWLVLQPMSAVFELNLFLCENGYAVKKRVFCRDGDKMYTALLCRHDGALRKFCPFEGAVRDENFYLYLEKELFRIKKALEGMSRSDNVDADRKRGLERLERIIISNMTERKNENQ